MTQYMLSVHHDSIGAYEGADLTPDDMQRMYQQVDAFNNEVQAAGAAIGHVVGSAEQVSSLTTELVQGLMAQKESIAHIDQAMRDLDNTTQQNAALAEQSAAAAESVRSQSTALVTAVGRFQLT